MKFKTICIPLLVAACAVSLTSCEKGKKLFQSATDKVNELRGGDSGTASDDGDFVTTVSVVNEVDGKAIVMNERRLVVIEFYSDT